MSDQQHWFVRARSMQAHHKILLAIIRPTDVNIAVGKSGISKTLRHGLGRRGDVADRICGIDFDQLLEDVVGELFVRGVELSGCIRNE